MALGERGARGCHVRDIDQHELEGAPADQHRRRVDDVLAGRPVVHVAGGFTSHRRAQCTHERLGRVTGPAPLAPDALAVVEIGPARGGDRLDGLGGDQAGRCLRLCERPLAVEHGLEPGAIAELVEQVLWREDRVEHG